MDPAEESNIFRKSQSQTNRNSPAKAPLKISGDLSKGFDIRKFDPKRITQLSKIVMIGKTFSGKSFCLRDLLYRSIRDIPVGNVISQTEFANRFYSKFIPGSMITDVYQPAITEKFLRRQAQVSQKYASEIEENRQPSIDPRAFLILDDCLSERREINKDKNIQYLFFAGRHVHTFFALCMQYPLGLTPDLRGNIDFVFLFRENNSGNRRRIYDHYAESIFPSFDVFNQIMNQCTENYGCLVMDINSVSNELKDQIFWYKAEPTPNFRLCHPQYWIDNPPFQSQMGFAKNDVNNTDDEYNPMLDRPKRRGPIINVHKKSN